MKAARDGANIVIAAKTAEPHPKLPGTIYTAAKEGKFQFTVEQLTISINIYLVLVLFLTFSVEAVGGKALPLVLDVRDEQQVKSVVEAAVQKVISHNLQSFDLCVLYFHMLL